MDIRYVAKIIHDVQGAYIECYGGDDRITWIDVPENEKNLLIKSIEYHIENID